VTHGRLRAGSFESLVAPVAPTSSKTWCARCQGKAREAKSGLFMPRRNCYLQRCHATSLGTYWKCRFPVNPELRSCWVEVASDCRYGWQREKNLAVNDAVVRTIDRAGSIVIAQCRNPCLVDTTLGLDSRVSFDKARFGPRHIPETILFLRMWDDNSGEGDSIGERKSTRIQGTNEPRRTSNWRAMLLGANN
jgi:hypothetical protein